MSILWNFLGSVKQTLFRPKFCRSCFGGWLKAGLNLVLVKRPECDY